MHKQILHVYYDIHLYIKIKIYRFLRIIRNILFVMIERKFDIQIKRNLMRPKNTI